MKKLKFVGISLVALAFAAGCSQGIDGAQLLETGDLGYNTSTIGRAVQRESLVLEHFAGGDVSEELSAMCVAFADSFGVPGNAEWIADCENPEYVWNTYDETWVPENPYPTDGN